MPTLFDALSAKLSSNDQDPTLVNGQQDQTQAALQAKTGKAVPVTGTPAASSVTEQAAIGAGQAQLAQSSQQAKLAGMQVQQAAGAEQQQAATAAANLKSQQKIAAGNLATTAATGAAQTAGQQAIALQQTDANEALKVQQLNATADQQARQLASDKAVSLDNIFRQFRQSQQDLAFRNDASELEHVGQVLALRDKSYVDEITRIGQERQLNDELNFKDESERLTLGTNMDALDKQLQFKSAMNSNQRDWDTYLAGLNADSAAMIAQAVIKDNGATMMYSGIGGAAAGGVDYAAKQNFGSGDDTTTPPQDNLVMQSSQNQDSPGTTSQTYDPMAGLPQSGASSSTYTSPGADSFTPGTAIDANQGSSAGST